MFKFILKSGHVHLRYFLSLSKQHNTSLLLAIFQRESQSENGMIQDNKILDSRRRVITRLRSYRNDSIAPTKTTSTLYSLVPWQ